MAMMRITHAQSGMEIIPLTQCLGLLASQPVGRLAFVAGDQPMVLPVNYALYGGVIVFRTGEGSKLEAAAGAKVAFEADAIDVARHTGWSVVVQGTAEEITDDHEWFSEVLRQGAAPSWLPGVVGHYVRINPTLISGRRLPAPVGTHTDVLIK